METVLLTIVVFAIMMAFLGVGLFFKRRCLRGTCSHAAEPITGPDGESLQCPRCEREVARRSESSGDAARDKSG